MASMLYLVVSNSVSKLTNINDVDVAFPDEHTSVSKSTNIHPDGVDVIFA